MYQLALAFKSMGIDVVGYDIKQSKYTKICEDNGIRVSHKFAKETCNVDLCIKTGAINDDDKFIKYLKATNVPIVDRADALGYLCQKFKTVIAVSGTHGKSTTASLIYHILRKDGRKVSCHIGADVDNSRFILGDDYLVVEACEYKKSFLSIVPDISVITNIEAEHMDSYGSLFHLRSCFIKFMRRSKLRFVMEDESTAFLHKYKNVNFVKVDSNLKTALHGEYNKKNVSLAVAVCSRLGVKQESIQCVLSDFLGVARRYEKLGKSDRTKIYIDYAHHPSELNSFISTFKADYPNSLIVFQPHTYSRTKYFLNEFVGILSNEGDVVIFKEYPARESRVQGLSARELYQHIKRVNKKVIYANSTKKIERKIRDFDAVAFVGAGDIDLIARKIIETNQKNT